MPAAVLARTDHLTQGPWVCGVPFPSPVHRFLAEANAAQGTKKWMYFDLACSMHQEGTCSRYSVLDRLASRRSLKLSNTLATSLIRLNIPGRSGGPSSTSASGSWYMSPTSMLVASDPAMDLASASAASSSRFLQGGHFRYLHPCSTGPLPQQADSLQVGH